MNIEPGMLKSRLSSGEGLGYLVCDYGGIPTSQLNANLAYRLKKKITVNI